MSTPDDRIDETADEGKGTEAIAASSEEPTPPRQLDLTVEITDAGPCKKHLKVDIAADEIKTQFQDSLKSMRKEAQVPGFRTGRAPQTLVQKRFKKEVAGQVKSTLVMAALEQIDKQYKLAPISRPDLDIEAIELEDDKPLHFEMDVEVQPDFPLPNYKELTATRPIRVITETDVDNQLKRFLERYAEEIPKLEGGAELGDLLTVKLRFEKDGVFLNETPEVKIRLQSELRFQDGHVPDLDKLLLGVRPGDSRQGLAKIGTSSPDPAIRGQEIQVSFEILDLKSYRIPDVDAPFLVNLGFDSESEFRTAIREMLERRHKFNQQKAVRQSILDQLIESTPFGLPPDLVRRQEQSTLRRTVFELKQNGMTDKEIQARESEIRANAHESTLKSLKEFFLLSKIAEAEEIKVEDSDIDDEIDAIAERTDESPRRVRSRILKDGLDDSLATQILERKTIERILSYATITDVETSEVEREVETVAQSAGPALAEPGEEANSTDGDDDPANAETASE